MTRKMKDSGIEWIGMIPEGWGTIKIKYTSWLKGRIGWQGLTASEYIDEGPYLVTGTDFMNGVIDWSTCAHITEKRFDEDVDIHIIEGDLLITKDGTIGKVAIVKNCPEKVSLNSGVLLIRNIGKYRYYDKYLYYVLLSDEFWKWYILSQTGQSTIKHLYQAQFYDFEYTFPPLPEQHRIAAYLDATCAQIDAVIEKTRASIEEYKKLKQAVITQAVTKGIRPGRKMKDSGIEWIGEIPEEWEYRKLMTFIDIPVIDGPHESPELFDSGVPYISATAIENGKINFDLMRGYISEEYCLECDKRYKPKRDDILLVKLGASTGQVAIIDTDLRFNIWVPLAAIRCNSSAYSKFIYYAFQSNYLIRQMELSWTFGTQQTLGVKTIEQLYFLLPIYNEQTQIVAYLDAKCAEIDTLIAKKQQLLAELESYKKSLIFEYVTGKKEVKC